MAVIEDALLTTTLVARTLPNWTVASLEKLDPEIKTVVPPDVVPSDGVMAVMAGAARTASEKFAVLVSPSESLTVTTKALLAWVSVGVPLMTPLGPSMVRPDGRLGETL